MGDSMLGTFIISLTLGLVGILLSIARTGKRAIVKSLSGNHSEGNSDNDSPKTATLASDGQEQTLADISARLQLIIRDIDSKAAQEAVNYMQGSPWSTEQRECFSATI